PARRAAPKQFGKRIGPASAEERPGRIAESTTDSDRIAALESDQERLDAEQHRILLTIPNVPHPDAPDGREDSDAVELSQFGTKPTFDFEPRDHVAIGEQLGIIDIERAVKISGSRFAFLLGDAVMLEFALVRYAMDIIAGHGFLPVIPPVLTRQEALFGTAFLPGSADQIYTVPEDDLYLVGTAEVPLAGMHLDEIFEADQLPLRYGGFSTCFRREAGTYGKDTQGIFRVHQFDKVEMFSWVRPEESWDEHVRLRDIQTEILSGLDLHGRVVDIAVGDLGDSAARKYDQEVWLPGQQRYRELTSASNCTDYQARRLQARYRVEDGTEVVHTLNGTACAVGRTIIAVLETHQRADGSVAVPEALVGYMGKERLTAAG
ncbi:serine--tRNA ligase, partial [Euzebya sp.]|uniref:serine--tRNA ligase n=1 Tax=Euzebya sp. TaxID=1971409 RepID=UPI003518011B